MVPQSYAPASALEPAVDLARPDADGKAAAARGAQLAGIFPGELRALLRRLIAERTAETESPLHRLRARDVTPGARERAWVRSLSAEVRERAVEAMAALA